MIKGKTNINERIIKHIFPPEIGFSVTALAVSELILQTRLASNSTEKCLTLTPSAVIKSVCHHAQQ